MHVWQSEGLGLAPFKFVSMWSMPSAETNPSAYASAMNSKPAHCRGLCDHCSTGIIHHCIIKSADGKLFSVGTSCVKKTNDTILISEMKALQNKLNRERSALKRAEKRTAENEIYNARMQAERDTNGGLTDYELAEKAIKDERQIILDKMAVIAAPVVSVLDAKGGDFCDSMAYEISHGRKISGRCVEIVIEIMTKQFGRGNSKAYLEAYPEQYDLVENVINDIWKLTQ